MASQTTEEILKFVVQATGNESLTPIVRSILDLSGNSAEAEKAVGDLLTQMADSQKLTTTLEQYRKVGASVLDLSKQYDAAKLRVAELGKSLSATDEPTKKQQQEFERARTALAKLGTQYDSQLEKLRGYKTELSAAGVVTNSFGRAQQQVKDQVGAATGALLALETQAKAAKEAQAALAASAVAAANAEAAAAKKVADAQAALAARLADGDEQFRRQAQASASARDALEKVRAKTAETAQAQADAASRSGILGSAWTKLAAIGATLVGYLSITSAVTGIKNLLGLADASEKTRIRLAALYGGAEAGNAAFAKLREISQANGTEFAATAEAATRLKSFGIDPLNGSLQALIDQNARLGGSQETLQGIILAVGQAWSKQKLQGEEILQLVERGVPVWDLLSKATGKNVQELQKLSEAGKLGRTEISALVQEIGRSAQGAAAQSLGTFGGLIVQLRDKWQQFLQSVADVGALDFAKQQLTGLIDEAKRLAADGTLTQWAKSTADGIKTVTGIITGGIKAAYDYSGAIIALSKAYATIKVSQLTAELGLLIVKKLADVAATNAQTAATAAQAGALGGLGAAAARIPTAVKIGVALVGAELAIESLGNLVSAYEQLREAQARLNIERSQLGEAEAKLAAQIDVLKAKYVDYANVAIKSSQDLAKLSGDQSDAYVQQLQNAQRYYRAIAVEAKNANDVAGFQDARQKLVELQAELERVQAGIRAIASATTVVQPEINAFAQSLVASFQTAYKEGKNAATIIREEFGKIDVTTVKGLTDAIEAIRAIGNVSTEAGVALEKDLRERLRGLSETDLARVREVAEATFAAGSEQAKAFGRAIESINLDRLGVDLTAIKTGFSSAGGAAVAAFKGAIEEVDKLGLTAEQQSVAIARAFDGAFAKAGTRPELEALRDQLNSAFSDGKISASDYAQRLAELNAKLEELANKSKPAAQNTRDVSSAMRDAGDAAKTAGEEVGGAAKEVENFGSAAAAAEFNLGNMSEAFFKSTTAAASAQKSYKFYLDELNAGTAKYKDQNVAFERRLALIDEEIAKYDPLQQELKKLRAEYDTLSDDALLRLLDRQKKLTEEKRRATEQTQAETAAQRELRAELDATAQASTGGAFSYERRVAVDVNVRADASAGAGTLSESALSQIASKVAPAVTRAVLDEIERDRRATGTR